MVSVLERVDCIPVKLHISLGSEAFKSWAWDVHLLALSVISESVGIPE